jgi:alkylated DNA repair dioxygenase AlkB
VQFSFFRNEDDGAANRLEGLHYQPEIVEPAAEQALIERVRELPFQEFDFHGYKGKRRVVSFGWKYEFSGGGQLHRAEDIPQFLLDLRCRAAFFAKLEPGIFEHVLVTEYQSGAGIGWHRDKSVFGQVVGISLLAPCILRFRRKVNAKWERVNVVAEPRSAYHLTGPARAEWEHSILRVDALRYSITFRTLSATDSSWTR